MTAVVSESDLPPVVRVRSGRLRRTLLGVAAAAIVGVTAVAVVRGVVAWTIARSVDRLDSPDALLCDAAAQRLRTLDDVAPLVAALSDERPAVRRRLVWVLAPRGADVTPVLLARLADTDPSVRVAACEALAPLDGDEIAAALAVAARDADTDVRRSAIAALANRSESPTAARDGAGDVAWRVACARAIRWLVSQQNADGGWHGQAYDVFEDGRSLTPFVLLALLRTPDDVGTVPEDSVRRALAFISANSPAESAFPTYATSLALRCEVRARHEGWDARAAQHVAWLRRAQCSDETGCPRDDPAHGAWGLDAARSGVFARADLSATCFALQALADAGVAASDPVMRRAAIFVTRCHNASGDGGYFLSTNTPEANKAGTCEGPSFKSYGTATADGVLARTALSGTPDADGVRWLLARREAGRAPGFAPTDTSGWDLGVQCYYAAARSQLRDALRREDDAAARAWEDAAVRSILADQRANGSWVSASSLMREDEPIVATVFCLETLARLRAR